MSLWLGVPEGPCLIHSMNGDLLRTLEGPEGCLRPRLIQASTEGHCVVYYDKGQFCLFSVNGKLLGHHAVEDSIKVGLPSLGPEEGLQCPLSLSFCICHSFSISLSRSLCNKRECNSLDGRRSGQNIPEPQSSSLDIGSTHYPPDHLTPPLLPNPPISSPPPWVTQDGIRRIQFLSVLFPVERGKCHTSVSC